MSFRKIDVKLGVDNAQLKKGLLDSQNLIVNSLNVMKFTLGGLAIGLGIKEIGSFALKAAQDFKQLALSVQETQTRLTQVMKNNQGATAQGVEDMIKFTKQLEKTGVVSARVYQSAGVELGTYLTQTDSMKSLLPVLGDMITQQYGVSASAEQAYNTAMALGKVLEGQVGALSRYGYRFTDAQERILKFGTEAQKVAALVDIIGDSVGGVNEALAKTDAGAKATFMNEWANQMEDVGKRMIAIEGSFYRTLNQATPHIAGVIQKSFEWVEVNNQVIGSIKDLSITLAALAVGIPLANAAILALIASMRSFNTITATTSAYQIALATLFKGQATLAMMQFRNAVIATTIQIRAFTASLFASPLGWLILIAGSAAGALYALKQSAESTKRAIEDLNNAQMQNINATREAINTIKELDGAQNLNLEQTKRLDESLALLTSQYPQYIGKLREELRLKGEITEATARQIAAEMMLAKTKGLQDERIKLNKDMMRDMQISSAIGAILPGSRWANKAGGRYGISRANQRRDDALIEQQNTERLDKELEAAVNTIRGISSESSTRVSSASSGGKVDEKGARKAAKEALDLRIANLEAERLETRRTYDEIYQFEVRKLEAKLANEKKGTADYQKILNERRQLDIDYIDQVRNFEIKAFDDSRKIKEIGFEIDKQRLQHSVDTNKISQEQALQAELKIEEERHKLLVEANQLKARLYADDRARLIEFTQEKLEIEKNFELTKLRFHQDIEREKYKELRQLSQNFTQSLQDGLSNILQGNTDIKNGFANLFDSIRKSWADTVAQMIAKKTEFLLFGDVASGGGFLKVAGNLITQKIFGASWFASGGIVPGNFSQPVPIVAHGSEMILNPFQQAKLWDVITGNANMGGSQQTQTVQNAGAPVIINQISPSFQSLDPALGQKMFNDWMKQSGIPLVRTSIKNNDFQMRDAVKNV